MDKISSILPNSPRTQKVDHSKAQPARPGAPLLGRPMGKVSSKVTFGAEDAEAPLRATTPDLSFADKFSVLPEDKVSIGEESSADARLAGYSRKGEIHKVKIAEEVSRKFANLEIPEEIDVKPLSEETLTRSVDSMEMSQT